MGMKNIAIFGCLVVATVVSFTLLRPSGTADAAPRVSGSMKVELIVEVGKGSSIAAISKAISNIGSSGQDGVRVDSFFDITYCANIGSSCLDGHQVDSFFDIFYSVAPDLDTEMVALSLKCTLDNPNDPGFAIDVVKAAAVRAGGTVYYGHVTVLK